MKFNHKKRNKMDGYLLFSVIAIVTIVGVILATSTIALTIMKYIGVVYLSYLGVKLWNSSTHPNLEKYPNQKLFIILIKEYTYYVPFVEDDKKVFLKNIIPSRKYHKEYKDNS